MNNDIFNENIISFRKRRNRTPMILCALLLAFSLFAGGCSAPENTSASTEPSTDETSGPEVSEETDKSENRPPKAQILKLRHRKILIRQKKILTSARPWI